MKSYRLILLCLLLAGFLLRLYKISSPIADWHSHRQADTVSVTRIFLRDGLDLLRPRYYDISNVQSGQENPLGYRMVEFPVYNFFAYIFSKILLVFPFEVSLHTTHRLLSVFISLLSAYYLFLLVKEKSKNIYLSFICLSLFLFLPFNIFYSRVALPEPTAILFMILTLYTFSKNTILSAVFFAISLLVKPFTGFLILPFLILLSIKTPLKLALYRLPVFSIISLLPFILWRLWISQFPQGIPQSSLLFNNSDIPIFPEWYKGIYLGNINKIVAFRPYWFRWLFYERIVKLILGYTGAIFILLSLIKNKYQKISIASLGGILIYFIIVAQGNIRHDYYQSLIMPSICLIASIGILQLTKIIKHPYLRFALPAVLLAVGFYLSFTQIKTFYRINNPVIIEAGLSADKLLPKDALVIAPYSGDTAFLYQTNRFGWPTQVYDIDRIKSDYQGKLIYLISTNYDDYTNSFKKTYPSVTQNDNFIILDLNTHENL